jgi:hypothetical protein
MLAKNTHSISNKPSKKTTKSHWYIGITLDWDYKCRQVHLSMPGYIKKALKQFKHERRKLQYQPYPSAIIKYGEKTQYVTAQSTSPQLDKQGKKFIQQVCGKSCFWDEQLTAHCCVPLAQSRCKQRNQPKTQWNKHYNYLITLQPKKKQSSPIARAT